MAGYAIDAYGEEKYGLGHSLIATLHAYSEPGEVIRVRWTYPHGTSWNRYRVTRSYNGQQAIVSDGETLIDRTSAGETELIDTEALPERRCYYSLWFYSVRAGAWILSASDDALCIRDYGSFDNMWGRLPQLYKTKEFGVITDDEDRTSQLARFIGLFAHQHDWLRTEFNELTYLYDPERISEEVLPSMLRQFGFDYEPALGGKNARKLARFASKIQSERGTPISVEDLATCLSGWYARLGMDYNILLDSLDGLTQRSIGRWDRLTTNCDVSVGTLDPLYGDGFLVAKSRAGGQTAVSFAKADHRALLTAVAVIQQRRYTASVYMRGTGRAIIFIDWYDIAGRLMSSEHSLGQILKTTGWTRMKVASKKAPTGARRAGIRVVVNNTTVGSEFHLNAAQLEFAVAEEPREWRKPRQPMLYLFADLVNMIKNPSGTANTNFWYFDFVPVPDPDDTPPVPVHAVTAFGLSGLGLLQGQKSLTGIQGTFSGTGSLGPHPTPVATGYMTSSTFGGNTFGGVSQSTFQVSYSGDGSLSTHTNSFDGAADFGGDGHLSPDTFTQFATPGLTTTGEGFRLILETASVDPVPVLGGARWVFQLEARSDTASPIRLSMEQKASNGDPLTTTTQLFDTTGEWQTINIAYRVPETDTGTTLTAVVGNEGQAVEFRRVMLLETSLTEPMYFDGNTPSPTGDYLWAGVMNASPTHFYSRRTFKARRIREVAKRFVPMGYEVDLVFAQDYPLQIPNYDYEPQDLPEQPFILDLLISWIRVITWDVLTATYTDWDDIAQHNADFDAVQRKRVRSWDQLRDVYLHYNELTAYSEPWLILALGY